MDHSLHLTNGLSLKVVMVLVSNKRLREGSLPGRWEEIPIQADLVHSEVAQTHKRKAAPCMA